MYFYLGSNLNKCLKIWNVSAQGIVDEGFWSTMTASLLRFCPFKTWMCHSTLFKGKLIWRVVTKTMCLQVCKKWFWNAISQHFFFFFKKRTAIISSPSSWTAEARVTWMTDWTGRTGNVFFLFFLSAISQMGTWDKFQRSVKRSSELLSHNDQWRKNKENIHSNYNL